jgi:hypothetical protein
VKLAHGLDAPEVKKQAASEIKSSTGSITDSTLGND